jgi:hypothetical protein
MRREAFENLVQVPTAAFWLWILYRKFVSPKPLPRVLAIPGRIFRLAIILVTFGLLAGCANPDPLAVASGPLFPLNAGHWQPTPQDMNAPPVVAHN